MRSPLVVLSSMRHKRSAIDLPPTLAMAQTAGFQATPIVRELFRKSMSQVRGLLG
jgi:hypothetical protein